MADVFDPAEFEAYKKAQGGAAPVAEAPAGDEFGAFKPGTSGPDPVQRFDDGPVEPEGPISTVAKSLGAIGQKIGDAPTMPPLARGVGKALSFAPALDPTPSDEEQSVMLLSSELLFRSTIPGAVAKRVLSDPIIRQGATDAIMKANDYAKSIGTTLTAAELTGWKTLAMWENLLSELPLSADVIQKFRQTRAGLMVDARENLLNKIEPVAKSAFNLGSEAQARMADYIEKSEARVKAVALESVNAVRNKFGSNALENTPLGTLFKGKVAAMNGARREAKDWLYDIAADAIDPEVNSSKAENRLQVALKWRDQLNRIKGETPGLKDISDQADQIIAQHYDKMQGKPIYGPTPNSRGFFQTPEDVERWKPGLGSKRGVTGQGLEAGRDPIDLASGPMPYSQPAVPAGTFLVPKEAVRPYTYQDLRSMRSEYADIVNNENVLGRQGLGSSSEKGRFYNDLAKATKLDMDGIVANAGEDAKKYHQIADAFYTDYRDLHDSDIIERLSKTDPQHVFDMVKRGTPNELRVLKNTIGPANFNTLFQKRLAEEFVGTDGVPDAAKVLSLMSKYDPEYLREAFGPTAVSDMKTAIQASALPGFMKSPVQARMAKLLKLDPDSVVKAAVSGNELAAKAFAFGFPDGRDQLKRKILERVIGTAEDERFFTSRQMTKAMAQYTPEFRQLVGLDDKTLHEIDGINNLVKVMRGTEATAANPAGTARTSEMMRLNREATKGAIYWVASSPSAGAAIAVGAGHASPMLGLASGAVIPLTAYAMARLYVSPIGRGLLREGLMPAERAAQVVTSARIASYLGIKNATDKK